MDTIKINLRIKGAILITGSMVTIVVALCFLKYGNSISMFNDILKIVGAGIALTTLVYTSVSINLAYKIQMENMQLKRKSYAIGFMTENHSEEMVKCSMVCIKIKEDLKTLSTKEGIKYIMDNNSRFTSIVSSLNFLEKIANAMKYQAADEGIIKEAFQDKFSFYYHNFRDFIEYMREERHSDNLWSDFQKFAIDWGTHLTLKK